MAPGLLLYFLLLFDNLHRTVELNDSNGFGFCWIRTKLSGFNPVLLVFLQFLITLSKRRVLFPTSNIFSVTVHMCILNVSTSVLCEMCYKM